MKVEEMVGPMTQGVDAWNRLVARVQKLARRYTPDEELPDIPLPYVEVREKMMGPMTEDIAQVEHALGAVRQWLTHVKGL